MAEAWQLKGQYMEVCTCDAICPCITLSDPTVGDCTAVLGWHIDEGAYGEVDLSGLNVAVALYSPGNMGEGNFKVGLLIDDRATEAQQGAIGTLWGGEAGGHLGHIAELITEVAGMETVPLTFESDGKTGGSIRIGDVGGAEWQAIEGQEGGPVTVEGQPLAIAPGYPAVVARATRAHVDAFGIKFDVQGRQAMMSPFAYAGP
ncbi:MAG: DUF1326 domain-containing protein [Acidobacteriota bacterium]|jgi:hypothetical protein